MFISLILIILSSYLFAAVFSKNKHGRGETFFLKFLLSAFSQIVLSFEILSLFKAISIEGVLICNAVFSAASAFVFFKSKIELLTQIENFKKNMHLIFKSLKRDKALIFSAVCFVFFILFQLITIFVFPVSFGDALAYYFPRCTSWIQEGSISHYFTPDTRELIMPVNMEFLYTWLMLFTKSERGAAIFSFLGYSGAVYVLFNLLRELNFSMRRSLWAVFVFSSFALVIIEMVTPCADLFTGALILGSIYLFIKSVKYSDKTALYFSALSAALAAGVKTTALIAAPSVFLIFCVLCMQNKKMRFKPLLIFSGLFIINFLIFSSYNYILNFIDYHNPVSNIEHILVNQFTGGFKGWQANVIKYFFALFDMSGMPSFININGLIEYWQGLALKAAGAGIKTGTSSWFPHYFPFDNKIHMMSSALGAMGLFAFAPSIIYALKRLYRKKLSNRAFIIGVLAFSIIFNVLLFARVMLFTGYNMRYLLTFVCIAAPAIAYSYPSKKHKLYKAFLCLIIFIYLAVNTHFRPAAYVIKSFYEHSAEFIKTDYEENALFDYFIKKKPAAAGLMTSQSKEPSYYIEALKLKGFKIYKLQPENIESFNLDNLEYIISSREEILSSYIVNFKDRMKYPDLFVSKCIYKDYRQNEIKSLDGGTPVVSECKIPFEYLKEKGFERDWHYTGDEYIVMRRR